MRITDYMSFRKNVLMGYLLSGLFACSSNAGKKGSLPAKVELPDSTALITNRRQAKDSVVGNDLACIRGQAEPVIKKKYFPNTTFSLQPDSLTGTETVSFKTGDKLIIKNWGCEYYVLTFRFETSRFKADTLNLKYWYATASKLMSEAVPGIYAPIDIRRGTRALNNYAAKNTKHLKLLTEIDFGGDEIRDFVTLDTISIMQRNRFAVVISFAKGPL